MNIASRLLLVRKLKKSLYETTHEELLEHQSERLQIMGKFAKENSSFYSESLKDIERFKPDSFPEMNKEMMMREFDRINTRGLIKKELLKFTTEREAKNSMDLFRDEYSVGMSSGTSGNRGLTVLSKDEMAKYSSLLWARNGIPEGIRKKHVLFALRINSPAFMEVRKFGVKIIYVDYTHPVKDLISKINIEKLNILAGPPSLLSLISREVGSIDHKIDCLISYAEVLTDDVKQNLEGVFKAPVVQIYQGSEGFIGTTCREGNLHINEDVLFIQLEEIEGSDDETRKVVVTDLYRTTQPIFRYQLNDLVEPGGNNCHCGSSFRTIKKVHGRTDDIFLLRGKGGERKYLFPDYVRRALITASDEIEDYQVLQHDTNTIEIRLVTSPGSNITGIRKKVIENLSLRAKRIECELGHVTFSDEPPSRNPRSGKMIRVVRMFKEEI